MQPSWDDILELANRYRINRIEYWQSEVIFSLQWWILLVTTIGLIVIWVIILDKGRIMEIVTYGALVAIVANFGDTIGLSFSLWAYAYSLVHTPEIIEVHNILMPIIYMIIYQYCHTWKSFIIINAANAIIFSLILEPLLIWLDIYELNHWKSIYSLVPYFIIAVGLKWIIDTFKQYDRHYQ